MNDTTRAADVGRLTEAQRKAISCAAGCVEAYGCSEMAATLREVLATKAEEAVQPEQSSNVMPPVAAPVSQHTVTRLDLLSLIHSQIHRTYASAIDREEVDTKYMAEIEEALKVVYADAELASRGRAQGGATCNESVSPTPSDSGSVDTATDLSKRLRAKASQPFGPEDFALLTQAADEIDSLTAARVATTQGMADCMDMVRQELIEAGIIDKNTAPMFIAEAVMRHVAGVRKDAERYQWMRRTFVNDNEMWPDDVSDAVNGEQLDVAIDVAKAAHSPATSSKAGGAA
jgi:hypothetical protein